MKNPSYVGRIRIFLKYLYEEFKSSNEDVSLKWFVAYIFIVLLGKNRLIWTNQLS